MHIVLEIHILVDGSLGRDLNDAVTDGAYELVVMAGHEDVAGISLHVVIESLDGLHVEEEGWVAIAFQKAQ